MPRLTSAQFRLIMYGHCVAANIEDAALHWIDPTHLPETGGTLDRFLINPHGDANGLLLTDGTEVYFPAHLSAQVVAAIKPGSEVTVRGIRPRGADMIAAVSLGKAGGAQIIDQGPPKRGKDYNSDNNNAGAAQEAMDILGVVKRVLHGPKGEKRGVLLEDGRIVRIIEDTAASLQDLLAPGHKLAVHGKGLMNGLGTVLTAHQIGASISTLRPVEPKMPAVDVKHRPATHDEPAKTNDRAA